VPPASARAGQLLPRLLLVLTAVTGMVDAASYLALGHVFTANMTGNTVLLAFASAGANGPSVLRSGAALAAFALGASVAGRIAARADAYRHKWTGISLGIEAGLALGKHGRGFRGGCRSDASLRIAVRNDRPERSRDGESGTPRSSSCRCTT